MQDSRIWAARSQQVGAVFHPLPHCNSRECQRGVHVTLLNLRRVDQIQSAAIFGEYWLSVCTLACACARGEGKRKRRTGRKGSQWDTDQSWLLSRLQVNVCWFSLLLHGTMNSSAGAGNYRRGSAKGDKVMISRAQTCSLHSTVMVTCNIAVGWNVFTGASWWLGFLIFTGGTRRQPADL